MEKNFYTDDFEQFLKETADDFRMYPSKRVWNSLYNNLHPGRKWPSLAVCLLLVSSIVFIGISHKSEITGSANLVKKEVPVTQIAYQQKNINIKAQETISPSLAPVKENIQDIARHNVLSNTISTTATRVNKQQFTARENKLSPENTRLAINDNKGLAVNSSIENGTGTANQVNNSVPTSIATNQLAVIVIDENETSEPNEMPGATLTKNGIVLAPTNAEEQTSKQIETKTINVSLAPIVKNSNATTDKEWIEDYAFHNQPSPPLKSKLLSELYITPSIGYRSFNKNVNYDIPARSSFLNGAQQESPKSVSHNSSFNFEAGYNLLYSYTKSTRLKAGVQLNYTSYSINAQDLSHSTMTTLLLNDPYSGGIELVERPSTLANNPVGFNTKLNNYTLQVALPFGADVKIAGKHNLQWFVGATLQPTYVLFGNAYLISSDMKNYVYDQGFLRKWNLNAGLETFLSYTTKSGTIFNAGPAFRYQFFSTYDKRYSYDEKLHSIGLKIGMVRNF